MLADDRNGLSGGDVEARNPVRFVGNAVENILRQSAAAATIGSARTSGDYG